MSQSRRRAGLDPPPVVRPWVDCGREGRGRPRVASLEDEGEDESLPSLTTARISLPARPSSCGAGRHFVRAVLAVEEWPGDRDVALLLTSELVANAIGHAHSPCHLSVRVEGSVLRIEAADGNRVLPMLVQPVADSAHGRGLVLLDALASAWGSMQKAGSGKTVWFELSA